MSYRRAHRTFPPRINGEHAARLRQVGDRLSPIIGRAAAFRSARIWPTALAQPGPTPEHGQRSVVDGLPANRKPFKLVVIKGGKMAKPRR